MLQKMPDLGLIAILIMILYTICIAALIYYIYCQVRNQLKFQRQLTDKIVEIDNQSVVDSIILKPEFNTKVNILIENMNYSDKLKTYIESNPHKYSGEVFLWESKKILRYLEIKSKVNNSDEIQKILGIEWKNELQNFDIISLPYFALQKAIEDGYIISMEDYSKRLPEGRTKLELFIKKIKNNQNIRFVQFNSKHFGIPFTEISTVIGYNQVNHYNLETNLELLIKQIETGNISFGILNNWKAGSHYYDFMNFSSFYGKDFLQFEDELIEDNLFSNPTSILDNKFEKALHLYLRFYLQSKKERGNWASMLDGLRLGVFDSCFLWTEQIQELKKYSYLNYKKINLCYSYSFTQGDGWFLCIVNKETKSYKTNLLDVINNLISIDFQQELQKVSLSSPLKQILPLLDLEFLNEKEENEENEFKKTLVLNSKEIETIVKSSKQKNNLSFMSKFIVDFSEIISSTCANKGIDKIEEIYNAVLNQVRSLITESINTK